MFNKFEHIGVAVRDLKKAVPFFEKLTGTRCYKQQEVESEGVITAFFRIGETKLELLQATRPDSPVMKFIESRGEGIHHIAFHVDNVEEAMEKAKSHGVRLISMQAKQGADNKLIAFMHPKDTFGVLMELCQEDDLH